MRKVIVAMLALSPMMLHAQAASPANTPAAGGSVLQSKLVRPEGFSAVAAADHGASAVATPVRVSTGVITPKLIHTVNLHSDSDFLLRAGGDRKVVVGMVVDVTGKPTEVKMLQGAGVLLDKDVLESVSEYRFKPGSVSGMPTAVPLTLEITITPAL